MQPLVFYITSPLLLEAVNEPRGVGNGKEHNHQSRQSNKFAEAKQKIQELRNIIWNWDKYRIEVEHNEALLVVNETATKRLITLGIVGTLVGLMIAITGFVLWYRRVQKYEDLILAGKVNDSDAVAERKTQPTPAEATAPKAAEVVSKAEPA